MIVDVTQTSLLLFIALVGIIGGLFRGYSGFGFSMGAVPILCILVPPVLAVPSVLFIELAIAIFTVRSEWGYLDRTKLIPLLIGSMIGTPLGLVLLSEVPADIVRFCLGIALCFSVFVVWHRKRASVTIGKYGLLSAGMASGVLNGGSAMSGPPVILALMATDLMAHRIRGTLIFYIGCSAAMGLVFSFIGEMQNTATLSIALILAPSAAIGAFIGARIFRRYQNRGYRTAGLAFLFCVALIAIGSSSWQLFH